jgi:tetratricopeptide (TPR) repeat protein
MRYSFVADHFQYHASVVFLASLAAVSARLLPSLDRRPRLAVITALPVLVLLAYLTWSRCLVYRDSISLWTDTLAKNPSAWVAHTNLGGLLADQGRRDEAIVHYLRAIELRPDRKLGYLLLGLTYFSARDLPRAIAAYERGLECPRDEPAVEPHLSSVLENNLGTARLTLGDTDEAIAHFRKAIIGNPRYADAHSNLGIALAARGDSAEAMEQLQIALRLNPHDAEARASLDRLILARDSPAGSR